MIRGVYRQCLWVGLGVSVALFVVFKQLYPHPNMVMDSYVYLRAAVLDMRVNSFPIGYSKFLQFLIYLRCNGNAVVWIQFLMLDVACLLLLYTVCYFFQPSMLVSILLFLFLFCNPLVFFMSNFIMSDTLFTALSLIWVVQLIWIIDQPKQYMIWSHALLLVLVFTVRYNALYYPVVSLIAFLFSRLRLLDKIIGIFTPLLLIGLFVLYTQAEIKKLSGVSQFSPFGGWQLANNALYMYGHVYQLGSEDLKGELDMVDVAVRRFFDSTHRVESMLDYNALGPGFYYSSVDNSPLFEYMHRKYGPDTVFQDFRKWGPTGALFSQYGLALIKAHPLAFSKYFVWPNAIRYFYPPTEIFERLSPFFLREDEFGKMAERAIGVKTLMVSEDLIRLRNRIVSVYPALFMLLNIFFILAVLGFFLVGQPEKLERSKLQIVWIITILWLCNFLFSITASCIVLRYQVLIMLVEFSFGLVLVDYLYNPSETKSTIG
jgi:hypothetical protein